MMKHGFLSAKGQYVLHLLLTLLWLSWLRASSAYYIPYLIVGIASILCVRPDAQENIRPSISRWENFWFSLGSVLFSLAVMLANYDIIDYPKLGSGWVHGILGFAYFLAGICVIRAVFVGLSEKVFRGQRDGPCSVKPAAVFAAFMALMMAVYLAVFFLLYRPGILTSDNMTQLSQIRSGSYTNHHPFYHTQLIRLLLGIGMGVFGNINKAVTLYSICQLTAMAAIFAYVLVTMYQKRVPRGWILLCLAWFLCMPFHIIYSFTMWKDILHAGMTILFLTALYRIFSGTGRNAVLNYLILTVSGLGFCLFRSNGFFAFFLFFLAFFCCLGKKYPKLTLLLLCILASSWVLKNPVLDAFGVAPPDTIESLSIPAQQIARTIAHDGQVSREQLELLGTVADVERIPELYREEISDPIKDLVRASKNQEALTARSADFLRLWIDLGLKNPELYLEAWVEQTKGYWNSGYDYWVWSTRKIARNSFDIHVISQPPEAAETLWTVYTKIFSQPLLCLTLSIGFHVWLTAGAMILAAAKKKAEAGLMALFLMAIVGSLMVATPVFSEFRYAYSVIASVPVILMAIMMPFDSEEIPAE